MRIYDGDVMENIGYPSGMRPVWRTDYPLAGSGGYNQEADRFAVLPSGTITFT